tara:strand:- start:479 stop:1009 length:531 start_codon:yes stop_codon:yes gene_type:complete
MDNITLELDFTGVNAASGGLGYLKAGLNSATIVEFAHFDDSNRLYAYYMTDGVRHRDSFNISSPNALPFLKAMLESANVPANKLGGKSKIPFHKLVGNTVYFNYVPPEMDSTGKAVQGSYPKYTYYTKDRYAQMQEVAALSPSDVEVETSNGGGAPVAQAAQASKADEDFDFLMDD